ncbi:hypothetical protein LTR49_001445 [Elasticomyces elasticus]|nr:hypothetical protein LTR49_001445 [Elasticomyces elasticus]
MSKGLCQCCQQVDLSQLFAPINNTDVQQSGRSLRHYEDERAIFIPDLTFAQALENSSCQFCRLIVECGSRAGLSSIFDLPLAKGWVRGLEPGENQDLLTTTSSNVRCCLRPKLAWSRGTSTPDGRATSLELVHEGQLHIWFYKIKAELKPAELNNKDGTYNRDKRTLWLLNKLRYSAELAPAAPATTATATASNTPIWSFKEGKSGVAFWTIDMVSLPPAISHMRLFRCPIQPSTNPDLLHSWLHQCRTLHNHTSLDKVARTRLEKATGRHALRAVNTTTYAIENLPGNAQYAALSYVWGREKQAAASIRRWITHATRIVPLSELPPTIRDAISLARRLGIMWLWVDQLCISQQDPSEMEALIPVIKDIFSLAELTLVAASGEDANVGLPSVGALNRLTETTYELPWSENQCAHALPSPSSFNLMQENSAWRSRGWTFEEQVFSQRLLYVFPTDIFFSCERGMFRESTGERFVEGSAGSTWDSGGAPPSIASLLHAKLHSSSGAPARTIDARDFILAVEHYTSRDLTFEEDRINAFAGIVTSTSISNDPMDDIALLSHGHPLAFFETTLTWHRDDDSVDLRRASHGREFAPSWSWASAGARVHFLDDGRDHSRNNWFFYESLRGSDILGIPAKDGLASVPELDLRYPQDIVQNRPWESSADVILPGYNENPDPSPGTAPRAMPRLHLLTVVFTANLRLRHPGQLSMTSIHNTGAAWSSGGGQEFLGAWSLSFRLPTQPNKLFTNPAALLHENAGMRLSSPQDPTPQSFAIVGGNNNMYIMLLAPHAEPGVFSRLGLLRVSLLTFPRVLRSIFRRGDHEWKYIQLA